MKNIYFKAAVFSAISMLTLSSCVKSDDYDVPEIQCTNRFAAANHQLTDLLTIAKPKPTDADIVKEDYIVEAYVGSSDESGNIYKMMFLQDKPENPTQGIEVDIDGGNQYLDFPTGALVRINLKGLIVQASNGNIKIGSYDPNYSVGRINPNKLSNYIARVCDGQKPVVAVMKPLEFNSIADALKNGAHINQLVKIKNVQYEDAELTKNFGDDAATGDRYITDKKAARLDLRFSNYATFAKSPISPKYAKSGDIVLLLSRYTSPSNPTATIFTEQAYIRNLDDMVFNNERFSPGAPENPAASAVNLFNGSDFENWTTFLSSVNSFGLKPYATQGVGLGYNATNSLQIKGTPTANDYVFTATAASGLPAIPKRITFYIKGTATGKSLSFNVYKTSGTPIFYTFNLGTFSTGAILDADSGNANSYTGSINTNGQWRLVELNLTGLADLNLLAGKDMFAIKTGNAGIYDIQIDNIKIE
jgi:hypothetical protein